MAGENIPTGAEVQADGLIRDWRDEANCRGQDHTIFFPEQSGGMSERTKKAMGFCANCDVKDECLEFALETNQPDGIWGGVEPKARKRLRKRWLADQRRNVAR